MAIIIPKVHRGGFAAFVHLAEPERARLIEVLNRTAPCLHLGEFSRRVATGLEPPLQDVSAIVQFLGCMFVGLWETGLSKEQFVKEVLAHARKLDDPKLDLRETEWDSLAACLVQALGLHKTLGLSAKAIHLLGDNEHSFHRARIVTDIRPVFGEDAAQGPSAAVIVQLLNLTYFAEDGSHSITIALDEQDLDNLGRALERAQNKYRALKKTLSEAKITLLGEEEKRG